MVFISFNAFDIKEKKEKKKGVCVCVCGVEDTALSAPQHFVGALTVPLLGLFCSTLGFILLPVGGEERQKC